MALVQDMAAVGPPLRRRLTAFYDEWLARLLPTTDGLALVAVGSLARGEVAPYGDIDLVMVHGGLSDVAKTADEVWYPLWDAGVSLDHSVRTVDEAVRLADGELAVALGLLAARPVAGDHELGMQLRDRVRTQWRRTGRRRVAELTEAAREREERSGELAFLVEPDLKQARGGLRDVQALQGLAVAQLADPPSGATARAHSLLLDVRCELHRRSGRALDRLVRQEQGPIAGTLLLGDADGLLRAVSDAGRTIAFAWDSAARKGAETPGRFRRGAPRRRPLADGVVDHAGEVVLARDADLDDPALPLRVAAAAAAAELPISPYLLSRMASGPPMPVPWPERARDALVALLAAGRPAVPVIEALDRAGLLARLLPEWEHVRSRPQRDPVHRFTVDRHLVETCTEASRLIRRVPRADVLMAAALLHDIGKGQPVDHSVAGEALAAAAAERMGFDPTERDLVSGLVRWHLLLADVATTRDLEDPSTVGYVVQRIPSLEMLDLLEVLTEADARATSPQAWTTWRAGLAADLASRVRQELSQPALRQPAAPFDVPAVVDVPPAVREDPRRIDVRLVTAVDGATVTVVSGDRIGLMADVAGALAVQRASVRSARAWSQDDLAVSVWDVDDTHLDEATLRLRFDAVAQGRLDPATRLRVPRGLRLEPVVQIRHGVSREATVVEVRVDDRPGMVYLVCAALARLDVSVRSAHMATLGPQAVGAFYVQEPGAGVLADQRAASAAHAVRSALHAPVTLDDDRG